MNPTFFRAAFVALFMVAATSLFGAGDEPTFRRFGLYVGSNHGSRERPVLSYATSDARTMAGVMSELGAVADEDTILLTDPSSAALERGFHQISAMVSSSRARFKRTEFFLYYSGHSDEEGLMLGDERVSYLDLRKEIDETGADVKIAILDSCASGAFTRLKGGARRQPFVIDESVTTKGYAFLTSSSADEASQESDRIGASFFTYYFVSGLRGAADSAQDGKVTLNEAYSYASAETLARTTSTEAGPQHPAYEIRLSGSGDLVLTDLRETSAAVVLDAGLSGRVYLRDSTGRLVAEVRKLRGVETSLSLPSGRYTLDLEEGATLATAQVLLRPGVRSTVAARSFSPSAREATRARGGSEDDSLVDLNGYYSFFPTLPFFANRRVVHGLSIVTFDDSYRIDGFQVGLGSMIGSEVRGAQVAAVMTTSGGTVNGVQAAGVFSIAEGDVDGAQLAGVFNVSGGSIDGAQSSGVFNIAKGSSRWLQSAGVFNINSGSFDGAQCAGVFNIESGEVQGGQAAGVFNIAGESLRGVQAAGVFNAAGETRGAQLGTVNVAGNLEGAQAAVVNVAGDVHGVQIGVVNICRDMYGVPIGLVNISRNGLHDPSVWTDGGGYGYLGFQLGSGRLYTLAYAGIPLSGAGRPGAFGLGLGVHNTFGRVSIDFDASAKRPFIYDTSRGAEGFALAFGDEGGWRSTFPSGRLAVGFEILHGVTLFGGLSVDCYVPGWTARSTFHSGTSWVVPLGTEGVPVEFYPQWFVGLRL